MHGAQVLPFACVDHFGNQVIIRSSPSNAWAERISKHLALSSLGLIACAFAALPASRVAEIYVPGTMSECLALGRAIREAREAGEDPVAAACRAIGGTLLFQGTVAAPRLGEHRLHGGDARARGHAAPMRGTD